MLGIISWSKRKACIPSVVLRWKTSALNWLEEVQICLKIEFVNDWMRMIVTMVVRQHLMRTLLLLSLLENCSKTLNHLNRTSWSPKTLKDFLTLRTYYVNKMCLNWNMWGQGFHQQVTQLSYYFRACSIASSHLQLLHVLAHHLPVQSN